MTAFMNQPFSLLLEYIYYCFDLIPCSLRTVIWFCWFVLKIMEIWFKITLDFGCYACIVSLVAVVVGLPIVFISEESGLYNYFF